MMRLLVACVCFVVMAVSAGGQLMYELRIKTGSLKPQTGRMFVILQSPKHINNVSMSAWPQKLLPYSEYKSAAQSPIAAPQLTGCMFQWNTLERQASPIEVKRVSVIPMYLQEPYRSQFTRSYCLRSPAYPRLVVPTYLC